MKPKYIVFKPVVKITGNYCNLRCEYCFYNGMDQQTKTVMSFSLLKKFITQFLEMYPTKDVKIVWHGGEPLLAGIDYFTEIVKLQKSLTNADVSNLLQTNATLISEDWISFFKENDFRIGLSLDGGKESHNLHRKGVSGKGTFEKVIKKIKMCKESDLHIGLIQTMTLDNSSRWEKDWEYIYSELGQKNWATNVFEMSSTFDKHKHLAVSDLKSIEMYKRLIDFWMKKNDPKLLIRDIDDYVAGAMGYRSKGCSYNNTCGNYFCLDIDGAIYPCDRFSFNPESSWGNLNTQNLKDILLGEKALSFIEKARSVHGDCKECEWLNMCNNGCSAMLDENGKYIYCETRKQTFAHVRNLINAERG